jgi:hypothetical protein
MTLLEITKQYRPCWLVAEESCYVTVTAEGTELAIFKPGEFPFIHFVGGVCVDCALGLAVCTWPECPHRSSPVRDRETPKDSTVDVLFRVQPAGPLVADEADAPAKRLDWRR